MVWQWPILRQISPRKLNVCQSNFTNNITTTNKLRPPFCWRTSLSVLVAAIPRSFDIHACGKRCMSRMDCQSIKQSVAILYSCYCIISFLKSLLKKTTHFFVADWKGGFSLDEWRRGLDRVGHICPSVRSLVPGARHLFPPLLFWILWFTSQGWLPFFSFFCSHNPFFLDRDPEDHEDDVALVNWLLKDNVFVNWIIISSRVSRTKWSQGAANNKDKKKMSLCWLRSEVLKQKLIFFFSTRHPYTRTF